jgi:hypothetical protein
MRGLLPFALTCSLVCAPTVADSAPSHIVGPPHAHGRWPLVVPPTIRIIPAPPSWALRVPRFHVFRGPVLSPVIPLHPLPGGGHGGVPPTHPRVTTMPRRGQLVI